MYSRSHAIISAIIGVPLAVTAPEFHQPSYILIYVVVLGVGIDLDHFVIARINRGDWSNFTRCIRSPSQVFVDQASIFERGDIWRDQRLFSHLLIGGVLIGLVWFISEYLAFVTAVTVYTHVIADLYSDMRTRDAYLSRRE
jgi:hypothetical protein